MAGTVVFTLAPLSLERKAHLLLGGLCAQRPSHSFIFDGHHLPFDARMTGIYLGGLVALVSLLTVGRMRYAANLSMLSWGLLAGFVGVMGIDGLNSLLVDLGHWHPYPPDNWIRLVTGLLAGLSLGVVLMFLLASSVWRAEARLPLPAVRPRDLAGLVAILVPIGLLVVYGGDWLLAPLTVLLIGGAITTVSALTLACLAIIQSPFGLVASWQELGTHAGRASTFGLIAVLCLAVLRLVAERTLGPLAGT
ncbi:MAG TPA: DUF2085 domain-containing protein [Thermomicrobiales bacterium]|nr:DUF2085 domain-containing protein [Thermomicrobiales bacterium]